MLHETLHCSYTILWALPTSVPKRNILIVKKITKQYDR